jgi:uncharacterized membrane protein (UPF0127 family)
VVLRATDDDGSDRRALAGFPEVGIQIRDAAGRLFEWCALLAATDATRAQGLMDQDDLRGYDAMAFRYDQPTAAAFYMFHTQLPLSLARFDAEGRYLDEVDMAPCEATDPADCPLYPSARAFTTALEVPRGDLPALGIGPGSTLRYGGPACR